jgi:hypothetical protein
LAVTFNPAISTGGAARDQEAQSPVLSPFLLRFSTLPNLASPCHKKSDVWKIEQKQLKAVAESCYCKYVTGTPANIIFAGANMFTRYINLHMQKSYVP